MIIDVLWPRVFCGVGFALSADQLSLMATSLRSNQWSCSELVKGAQLCADMAGLDLTVDPSTLSHEQLLKTIKDPWQHKNVFNTGVKFV